MTAGDGAPADGALLRLVGGGLQACGFDIRYPQVRYPELGSGSTLTFGGLEKMVCRVAVSDCGAVEWEWLPEDPRAADAWQIGSLVASVLAGRTVDCARDLDGKLLRNLSLKGAVAHYLKASGLDVCLEVYEDTELFEAVGDISVTGAGSDLTVYVDDRGAVVWQHNFWPGSPDHDPPREDIEHIAKTIVGTVALAVSRAVDYRQGTHSPAGRTAAFCGPETKVRGE
jgi:hypothetical protein